MFWPINITIVKLVDYIGWMVMDVTTNINLYSWLLGNITYFNVFIVLDFIGWMFMDFSTMALGVF